MIPTNSIDYSASLFQLEYRRFAAFVEAEKEQGGERFSSFLHGFTKEQEFYKTDVHREALKRLNVGAWTETDVGTGRILESVIAAIEIKEEPSHPRNNLVNWEGRQYGESSCTHLSLYEAKEGRNRTAYESALFDLYKGQMEPEDAMEELIRYGGRKYDFLAYLLFIHDWEQFMPIAPTYFEKGFARLGVTLDGEPFRLSGRASWENYTAYNAALQMIREALRGQGIEHVRLLDAHSFVFMLARIVPEGGPLRPLSPEETEDPIEPLRPAHIVDFEKWQAACRLNGKLAEEWVEARERQRLVAEGRADLAACVRRVSDDHTLGYDIASVETDERPRYIEVKSARRENGAAVFYLTENERQRSRELANYWFCLVFKVRSEEAEAQFIRAEEFADTWLTPVVHAARVPSPSI